MALLNRFNWIASNYDRLARVVYGNALRDSQKFFLPSIPEKAAVLIIGGGSGTLLLDLIETKPQCHIVYIEASSEMIRLAKQKVAGSKVKFIHGTEESLTADMKFDVIIANFFFDVLSPEHGREVVQKLAHALKDSGKWIVTDFQKPVKLKHKVLLQLMLWFFGWSGSSDSTNLWDWNAALNGNGLFERESKDFYNGFIRASIFSR